MSSPIYQPSAWGQAYHALTVREALGGGAAGPGKSVVLRMDPLARINVEHDRCVHRQLWDERGLKHWSELSDEKKKTTPKVGWGLNWGLSNGWGLHLRREARMLDQTISESVRLYSQIDSGMRWNQQSLTMTFSSGYKLQFGHCKDPDDYMGYFSSQYDWMGFDEVIQFLKKQYEALKTRVRSSDPILRNHLAIRSMTNPVVIDDGDYQRDENPNWVREYFVEPYKKIGGIPKSYRDTTTLAKKIRMNDGSFETVTRVYFPAQLEDNPDPEFRRSYEITLQDSPPHIRAALLYADWYVVAGAFFSAVWRPNMHVCRPFKIPKDWIRFRSMDWGYRTAGCVHWYALDPDGTLWVEKEFTFNGGKSNKGRLTAVDVAKRIKEIEKGMGLWKKGRSPITGPADTQLWEQRGEQGKSKAEEMAMLGVGWVPADKRSERRNAERLEERLCDHDDGTKNPGIVFFSVCVQAISTIPAIPTDPKDSTVPADCAINHWYDSVKYGCAYASRRDLRRPDVKEDDDLKDDDEEDDSDDESKYGRDGYGATL